MRKTWGSVALVGALAWFAGERDASAFCGFYVSGADTKLFNNATQVVLMREGTRTVLSMQNNYQGPPQNFAMVVPVPVVLQKENVKTLPRDVFAKIDQLDAPRLVEYWEQDPCAYERAEGALRKGSAIPMAAPRSAPAALAEDLGVTVEAKFAVGEYDVVILSAKDGAGLDTWLRREGYKIPDGAEPYLRPYVQAGSKFFVAKVDVTKVRFENGMATLSPLRFHYDSETFSLPVRLGLMNSGGTQDLIVHILARGQRYDVANYPNATIPTNFDVSETARGQFGAFYAALFDRTVEKIPKAVVTEYAWDAGSCDPCPTPPLGPGELSTLGADVLPSSMGEGEDVAPSPVPMPQPRRRPMPSARPFRGYGGGFTLTRLHARYAKDSLGEDLVFRAAPPIAGGREVKGQDGKLEHGSSASGVNTFQGRYAIRHPWTGPVLCKHPQRGIWGGPPGGAAPSSTPARDLAFAPRGKVQLASFVKGPLPEVVALPGAITPLGAPVVPVPPSPPVAVADVGAPIVDAGVDAGTAAPDADAGASGPVTVAPEPKRGCGCEVPGGGSQGGLVASALGGVLAAAVARIRRSRTSRRST